MISNFKRAVMALGVALGMMLSMMGAAHAAVPATDSMNPTVSKPAYAVTSKVLIRDMEWVCDQQRGSSWTAGINVGAKWKGWYCYWGPINVGMNVTAYCKAMKWKGAQPAYYDKGYRWECWR